MTMLTVSLFKAHLPLYHVEVKKEGGIKDNGRYATTNKLPSIIKERKMSNAGLSKLAGCAASTVGLACRGNRIA